MRRRRVAAQRSTKAEVAITANQVEAKRASMRWHGIAAHLKTDNERSTASTLHGRRMPNRNCRKLLPRRSSVEASLRWRRVVAQLKTENERSTNAERACADAYTHHSETESFHITWSKHAEAKEAS